MRTFYIWADNASVPLFHDDDHTHPRYDYRGKIKAKNFHRAASKFYQLWPAEKRLVIGLESERNPNHPSEESVTNVEVDRMREKARISKEDLVKLRKIKELQDEA